MAAPIVYRWDDGNAPVARGERRSLCDILYACLVTGYGAKPGAGWTREYVNATFDKAAFRNNPVTGTGFYLQADGLGGANAYTPRAQGFEVMTSEDAGLFPFNAAVQTGTLSNTANTTARPWVLIADDRAFWFICWPVITAAPGNTSYTATAMFFGDPVSRYPSDAYACGLVFNGQNGSYGVVYASSGTVAPLGVALAMPRRADGVASPLLPALVCGGGPGATGGGRIGQDGLPYAAGDQILITRPYLNEGAVYTFRGWMPGLYYPCHPLAFDQLATISLDGKTYLSLRHFMGNAGSPGNYFISLDDWRV